MSSVQFAKNLINEDPNSKFAKVLENLVLSLESEKCFDLQKLYDLSRSEFDTAIEIMKDWRISRFYLGNAKCFDARDKHQN